MPRTPPVPRTPRTPRAARVLAPAVALGLAGAALAACSPAGDDDAPHDVVAAFYPLQFVAERVGGEHVAVTSLTPPGGESHDLELSPSAVSRVGEADLVVYLSGFQAATDAAVAATTPAHVVDTAEAAALEVAPDGVEPGAGTGLDPHFWLDPTRLADVAHQVGDALAEIDPEHAGDFAAAADALVADLDALDVELEAGLAVCRGATLVASHEAFGYLAQRYGLHQVGLSGIDPEVEPSPARLRDVAATVEAEGVRTLFFETLTSPKVTRTLADDLGVATAVLDPLEGLAEDDERDYLDVMRDNLAALTAGLTCGA
ncbi:zinc ABC transporter substrate-binding protein [Cellulomonas hominis]|uniref:Zinc ABC transporter substrate-binding protein n=1 Tax=Cellulomonas hominis TaxID=156981 RepID=A0A7Z8JYB3_9CELL|nr:metal ABC transporter substrate-binding protein [Cellulomonas hominis]TKR22601.1 zinc ABC transporter substrate-binding protein [Cellulomonas hominis]